MPNIPIPPNLDKLDERSVRAYLEAVRSSAVFPELNDLTDITISSPSAGQTIIFDATDSKWENASLTEGNGIDITNADASITIAGEAASTTNEGIVELATSAETNAGTATTLAVTPDGLTDWTGSTNLTTLGTIVTGTWNGTTVAVTKGGTGQTSYTNGQLLIGNTTGNTLSKATLTGGTNLTVTNGTGTITLDVDDAFLSNSGDTGTGAYDFGGADSFEIPNSATPTVDAAGEIAIDTTITDYTGMIKYYDGSEELTVVAMPTGNLSTTDGNVVAYNAANNEFEMVANSATFSDSTFRATMSANQSINNATFTKVVFNTETFDTNADYDPTTNYRFTPTVSGKYRISAGTRFQDLTSGAAGILAIYKNGASATQQVVYTSTTNDDPSIIITDVFDMNGSTDYIEIYVWHNHGSARNILTGVYSHFEGHRIAQ